MTGDLAEILFKSFLLEALLSSSGKGSGCSLFDAVHPAFTLPTTASPNLQGASKDGFGEVVVAWTFPNHASLKCHYDSCQKRVLWTYKEVNLAPHPAVGLVVQAVICTMHIVLMFFYLQDWLALLLADSCKYVHVIVIISTSGWWRSFGSQS